MTTRQVLSWLEDASDDIARVLAPTDDGHETCEAVVHTMRRLFAARPALPGAQAFDTDRVSSSGSSSHAPPGFGQEDKAQADRDEAHRRAKRMREDADWFVRLLQRSMPREPTQKDRQLSSINQKDDPGCEHCAIVGKWEAVYVEASDAKGNLDRSYRLGYFCYRYALDTGTLPTRKQLEDHHAGVRVKRPA